MSSSAEPDTGIVETYRFTPDDLRPATRLPGISAFMRVKNGAEFIEAAIRSHIAHFDEIVVVHNQCTDATPDILARLGAEYGPERLPVYHYLPKVFPPGSEGHKHEPADSPRSLVNYCNFSLSRTRYRTVTKLDDDHLAIDAALGELMRRVRGGAFNEREMVCFSGLNAARDESGKLGILAREPFSGGGDIGFFTVTRATYFVHDRRFERFNRQGLRRRFGGIVYWHLKYLKAEFGFANYDLGGQTHNRYSRKMVAFFRDREVVDPPGAIGLVHPLDRLQLAARRLGIPLPEKARLRSDRWSALRAMPAAATLRQMIASGSTATASLPFAGEA